MPREGGLECRDNTQGSQGCQLDHLQEPGKIVNNQQVSDGIGLPPVSPRDGMVEEVLSCAPAIEVSVEHK